MSKNQELIDRFIEYVSVEKGLAPPTIEAYRGDLASFCAWLRKNPAKAQRDDVRDYLAECREAELAPRTIGRYTSTLREFYKHLQIDGLIPHDPMRGIELPKLPKRLPRWFAYPEIHKLLQVYAQPDQSKPWAAIRNQAILETLYATGGRASGLASAKLEGLNLEARTLTVFEKGSKERKVPLNPSAVAAIRAYLMYSRPLLALVGRRRNRKRLKPSSSPFLFISRRAGRQLTRQMIWQVVKEAGRQVGINGVGPHMLRHSCATHMVENGADLRTVQEILGHADISTTEVYTHNSPKHLLSVMRNCNPRWSLKRNQMPLAFSGPDARPRAASTPTAPLVLCSQCIGAALPDKTLCEKHLLKAREASLRSKERKRAKPTQPEPMPDQGRRA